MSSDKASNASKAKLADAARQVASTKKQFASTMGALQYRLKPATLMTNAWDGVRDKSGEVADTTLQKVKDRPLTVSGVLAAILLFLARDPLRRLIMGLFSRDRPEEEGTIKANLEHEKGYDLAAPTVEPSRHEGVNA